MFSRALTAFDGIRAGAFLVGGFLLGFLVYEFVRLRLKRSKTMTSLQGADVLLHAIRDAIIILLTLGGAYASVVSLPFNPRLAEALERSVSGLAVIAATIVLMRLVGNLVRLFALRTPGAMGSSSIFVNIARLTVLAIGLLVFLQSVGVSITPLLTALGVGGLAAALALQDTLANLFAGIHIIASRKVQPGDYVQLDSGEDGHVADINWRNTTVRQLADNIVIVPNARMASAVVTNFDQPGRPTAVLVGVGAAYGADLEQVERVTIDVAREVLREVPGGVKDFEPFIRYHTFNDSSIDFNVILRVTSYPDRHLVVHEFIKRLQARWAVEGIEFPFPHRTIDFADDSNGSAVARVTRRSSRTARS